MARVFASRSAEKVSLHSVQRGERKVDENVRATKLWSVGRYALQIAFTSGCSQGIYHFSYLRRGEVE